MNNQFISIRNLNRLMDDMFPIPPPTKGNAATKIQKTVRGMRNRTMVKKMKTVAGRVSLRRAKQKSSSIKTKTVNRSTR